MKYVAIGHAGLNVSDLDRSIVFYTEVVGLDVIGRFEDEGRRWAFLGSGGQLLVTLWEQSEGRFTPDRPGLHHLAFRANTLSEVEELEVRARAAGAGIFHGGIVSHRDGAGSGGLFFEDPDGIRLEVSVGEGVEAHTAPFGAAPTCGFF